MGKIIEIIIILFAPALVLWAVKKCSWLRIIGATAICYALGMIISIIPTGFDKTLSQDVASVLVAIAIPLILFSFDIRSIKNLAKEISVAFILMIITVVGVTFAAALAASKYGLVNADAFAAMASGLYTGGTPNLIAVGNAVLPEESAAEIIAAAGTADFFVGGVYFAFVLLFVGKIYKKVLGKGKYSDSEKLSENISADEDNHSREFDFTGIFSKKNIGKLLVTLLLAVGVLGIGVLIEYLINGNISGSLYIMITVSVLGMILGLVPKIRNTRGNYQCGNYLVLSFALGIGMSIDIKMLVKEILPVILFFAVTQTCVVIVHFILCKIFGVGGGAALVTSIAGIYGPPFIASSAQCVDDKSLIAPGIICAVSGLVIGNFLGIGLFALLGLCGL